MKLFVTVGTTKFDEMVAVVDSEPFAAMAAAQGVTAITVQLGHGARTPTGVPGRPDAACGEVWTYSRCGVQYEAFRLKTSVAADVEAADVVVSHAGAGSVFEAVRAGKPLVVVVNDTLQGNHQVELAEAMASRGCLKHCTPAALVATFGKGVPELLAAAGAGRLHGPTALPPPDLDAFRALLDKAVL